MNPQLLRRQNQQFQGTAGVSQNNRTAGFRPAFQDNATGRIYLSRFRSGQPAPLHLLDGLPDEVVTERGENGHVTAVQPTITAGFVLADRFYTREQAAGLVALR